VARRALGAMEREDAMTACIQCQQREARRGSDLCGQCLLAMAKDLSDGLVALVAPQLGARAIQSVEVPDDRR